MKNRLWWLVQRPILLGGVVAALLFGVLTAPMAVRAISPPAVADPPVFPQTVAPYSWWTAELAAGELDAATMIYQNGYAVEFLDIPQAVVLGSDGSTYRRLGAAEARTVPADQGDPAATLLAPDGSFVVIAGGAGHGEVEVVTLRDLQRRSLPVGKGRSAIPLSIALDGRTALLLTSGEAMSRYADTDFRLHGGLARLDLETGEVYDYPGPADVSTAALSPDGAWIAADTPGGIVLVDAVSGRVERTIAASGWTLMDDAWSPSGERLAVAGDGRLAVIEVYTSEPVVHDLTPHQVEWAQPIGWRDDGTLLVHGTTDPSTNASAFAWIDVATGAEQVFSSYRSNFTAAALGAPDVARDLVPRWDVRPAGISRGSLNLGPAVIVALFAGLLAGTVAWRLAAKSRAVREFAR